MSQTQNHDRDPVAVKEDVQFILSTGGDKESAAKRLGFPNRAALEAYLKRHRG